MPNPCQKYECHIYKQSDSVRQLQSDMIIIHQMSGWHFAHIHQSAVDKKQHRKCNLLVGQLSPPLSYLLLPPAISLPLSTPCNGRQSGHKVGLPA